MIAFRVKFAATGEDGSSYNVIETVVMHRHPVMRGIDEDMLGSIRRGIALEFDNMPWNDVEIREITYIGRACEAIERTPS